jgi:hypothetical protein
MNFEQKAMWERLQSKGGNYYTEAAEPERAEFRQWMKSLLREHKVVVEFIKADGSTRAMVCTLNEENGAKYVVNENQEASANKKKPNDDVCAVWDCEQGAWRSFRWDRLKRIEFSVG